MDSSYNLKEALTLAEAYYRADVPFALVGPHGIGKSLGLQDLAKKLEIGFVDLRLTLCDETDLVGAPFRPEGSNVTHYSKPIWIKLIEEAQKPNGFLIIEEINRADRLVRQPALQLLWDRKCLHWNLPSGWLPISCWNPDDGNYEVFEMDDALLSRLVTIPVKVDPFIWLEWAEKSDEVPREILEFIEAHPTYLTEGKLTPRHWHMAGRIYKFYPQRWDLLEPLLNSTTYNLRDFIQSQSVLPAVEDIWNNWDKIQSELDALKNRLDLLYLFENRVLDYVVGISKRRTSESFLLGLQKFLQQLPSDAVLAWFQRLKQRDSLIAKRIAQGFAKDFRIDSVSLVTHLFGEKNLT